jgi:hypothetical protein
MAWFLVQGFMINHEGGNPPGFGGGGSHPGMPGFGGGWGSGAVDPGWGQRPPVDPGFGRPGGGGPVDPGFGGGGLRPGMPGFGGGWGSGAVDPGWGGGGSHPGMPGFGGGWGSGAIDPGFGGGLPAQPGRPDQGLPPGATPKGTAVAPAPPDKVDPNSGAWLLVNVQGALVWAWAQKPKEQPPEAGTKPITPPPAQPKT